MLSDAQSRVGDEHSQLRIEVGRRVVRGVEEVHGDEYLFPQCRNEYEARISILMLAEDIMRADPNFYRASERDYLPNAILAAECLRSVRLESNDADFAAEFQNAWNRILLAQRQR